MINRNALMDDLNLAAQTVIGESRAAAGHFFGRAVEQNAAHGGRGCRVANAHFAGREELYALRVLLSDELDAGLDGL